MYRRTTYFFAAALTVVVIGLSPLQPTSGPLLLIRSVLFVRRSLADAETQNVTADAGIEVIAVRRAAAPSVAGPAAATPHVVRTRCRPRRIVRGRMRVVPRIRPVFTPLRSIPVHVGQAPCVRSLLPYGVRLIV